MSLKMDVLFYSEEAAKESLVYVYKNAATGFSAKLTPDQASQLESMMIPPPLVLVISVIFSVFSSKWMAMALALILVWTRYRHTKSVICQHSL